MRCFRSILVLALVAGPYPALWAEESPQNRFVYAQLRHSGEWDPYPGVWDGLSAYLRQTTSVQPWPERRVLSLDDPRLFESPFLVLAGRGAAAFSDAEAQKLKAYLDGGGFLLIDDTEAERNGPFGRAARGLVETLFPGSSWEALPADHVVFRSFFLLHGASGRRFTDPVLRGFRVQGRVAAVYCANDLHGAWARDNLGNYLFACEPGGDVQRATAVKLLVNLVMFSLTGTYKTDAVHQPFLERKLTSP